MIKTLFSVSLLAVLCLTQAPAQTEAPAASTNAAIVPAQRNDDWPKKRYEELNRRVKEAAGDVDLVFLGDSITQGWEGGGKNVWAKFYGERKALNLGIGGDRTQHVLWRLDNGNFEGLKPKALVLMIGTNNSNGKDHTPGEILEGVLAIVRKIQALSPATRILVLGIFPRGQNFNDQRGKLLQINQALAKLEDGNRVWFIDLGSKLIEADGSISKAVMPDYLHLSERGYQIWAETIEPKLAELLGSKAVASPAVNPAGQWTWQMKGPNGEDVTGPLALQVDGTKVAGEFRTDGGRSLAIREGTLAGNKITFKVVRDRPQGGEMTYRMEGAVNGDQIDGQATAEFEGREIKMPWSATRK